MSHRMNYIPTLLCDFYKISHREMYPPGTELVYSTWTPRTSRILGVREVVAFGFQAFFKKLEDIFQENFFSWSKEKVVTEYARTIRCTLGIPNPSTKHIEELYDYGKLPIEVWALPEGTLVPTRVPMMTIQNTDSRFFWFTNYIETLASSELWQMATSATIARQYRKILDFYAMETVGNTDFVQFQGHDFSMRGMSSLESAISSGMGHLLSFVGTDTIPAINATEYYYGANIEKELVGTSIPATEHSIQCSYEDDMAYFEAMISRVHPSGFVSIVADGYDFWDVINRVLPALKDKIMARTGGPIGDKVVIRPDSGDPVKIVCGDPDASEGSLQRKGAIEALWDIFGGTRTEKGYRLLDSHIGLIYGDAITIDRATAISKGLMEKGFASINCVYGIGSFTYQYNTRDTFGFALKSTLVVRNGKEQMIFKDPKTDDGTKKSQRGRVMVTRQSPLGSLRCINGLSLQDRMTGNLLRPIYREGQWLVEETFSGIRERLKNEI